MKNRTTVFLCAVIISSGVFARGTRSIAVSVNATDGVEIRCPILYFAQGSGNDFLRDLGYDGKEPVNINEYIKNLPLVEVNGKTCRFLNNVGFGIDGYCCEVGDAKKAKGEKGTSSLMGGISQPIGRKPAASTGSSL